MYNVYIMYNVMYKIYIIYFIMVNICLIDGCKIVRSHICKACGKVSCYEHGINHCK